uniref:hypothetical protein n=1 Tax=Candidatus Cryptobacteroides bacterium TaxID=3085639 RepID=UPI004028E222
TPSNIFNFFRILKCQTTEPVEATGASTGSATLGQPPSSLPETANITRNLSLSRKWLLLLVIFIGNSYFSKYNR